MSSLTFLHKRSSFFLSVSLKSDSGSGGSSTGVAAMCRADPAEALAAGTTGSLLLFLILPLPHPYSTPEEQHFYSNLGNSVCIWVYLSG